MVGREGPRVPTAPWPEQLQGLWAAGEGGWVSRVRWVRWVGSS